MQIKKKAHPQFGEGVDGLLGVLGEEVVEEGQRGEGVVHAQEGLWRHPVKEVALQVQGGQLLQATQRPCKGGVEECIFLFKLFFSTYSDIKQFKHE